jgi:hypothetical protein
MKYATEMASCGMIYIPSYVKIGIGVQAILGCFLRNLRLQCWYCWWEGYMNQAVEMGSCTMTYTPSFIKIASGIQKLIEGIDTQTASQYHKPTFIFQNKEGTLQIVVKSEMKLFTNEITGTILGDK